MKPLYTALLLTLASCATEQATLTTGQQLFTQATDTSGAIVPLALTGKFKGPVSVVVQMGTGNVATPTVTDSRKTGQRAQAVSTGASSPIKASQKRAGLPLAVYVGASLLLLLAGAAGWEWFSHRGLLAWLPWRARPN